MLKLQRIGKKHQAAYRLIVGEKRTKLNGKQREQLGSYNPHTDEFKVKAERIQYWLKQGAQPTERVASLLTKNNIVI